MHKLRFMAMAAGGIMLAMLLSSCSGRPKLCPVRGKVVCKAMAMEGALVILHPTNPALQKLPSPQGVVGKDGTFQISTYRLNDGAPAGEYRVTVALEVIAQGGDRDDANVISPIKYASAETTDLTIVVREDMADLEPFVIQEEEAEQNHGK